MAQISGITYLIETFPLFLLTPFAPTVIRENLLLIHQRIRNIQNSESRLYRTETIVRIITKDKQILIGIANLPNNLTPDKRSLKSRSLYLHRPCYSLFRQLPGVHGSKRIRQVIPLKLMREKLPLLQTARSKYTYIFPTGMLQ